MANEKKEESGECRISSERRRGTVHSILVKCVPLFRDFFGLEGTIESKIKRPDLTEWQGLAGSRVVHDGVVRQQVNHPRGEGFEPLQKPLAQVVQQTDEAFDRRVVAVLFEPTRVADLGVGRLNHLQFAAMQYESMKFVVI